MVRRLRSLGSRGLGHKITSPITEIFTCSSEEIGGMTELDSVVMESPTGTCLPISFVGEVLSLCLSLIHHCAAHTMYI